MIAMAPSSCVISRRLLRFCNTDAAVTPDLDVNEPALFYWRNACYEGRASARDLNLSCLKQNR